MVAITKKEVYNNIFKITIPLTIQQLLTSSLTFIDQVLVSHLGINEVAAVGASLKIFFIFQMICYGIGSASAIFMSQFYGSNDLKGIRRIIGYSLSILTIIGLIMGIVTLFFSRQILEIFTSDLEVIQIGIKFLRAFSPIYIIVGVSTALMFFIRSINRIKVITLASFVSVLSTIIFGYSLIYGIGFINGMGVLGATIATILSKFIELLIVIVYLVKSKNQVFSDVKEIFKFDYKFFIEFIKMALPLMVNELLWSLGQTVYFIVYGKIGTVEFATMSIMQTLQVLTQTIELSFAFSTAIIIGNAIGRKDYEGVNLYCKIFQRIAIGLGIATSIIVLITIKPVLLIYGIDGTVVGLLVKKCMFVLAAYTLGYSYNILFMEGIFRSGGATKYIMCNDMGSIWLIGLPFTLITAWLNLDIYIVFSAFMAIELYKLPINIIKFKSNTWLYNVTIREHKDLCLERE